MSSCVLTENLFLRRELVKFYEDDNELVLISSTGCEPVADALRHWINCDGEIYVLAAWNKCSEVRSLAAERILQSNLKSKGYEVHGEGNIFFARKKAEEADVGDVVNALPRWKGITFYLARGNVMSINGASFRTYGISCRLRDGFVANEREGVEVVVFVTHIDGCELHVSSKHRLNRGMKLNDSSC